MRFLHRRKIDVWMSAEKLVHCGGSAFGSTDNNKIRRRVVLCHDKSDYADDSFSKQPECVFAGGKSVKRKQVICFRFAGPPSKINLSIHFSFNSIIPVYLHTYLKRWSRGRVARQRSAKPCTAVRIRPRPPLSSANQIVCAPLSDSW